MQLILAFRQACLGRTISLWASGTDLEATLCVQSMMSGEPQLVGVSHADEAPDQRLLQVLHTKTLFRVVGVETSPAADSGGSDLLLGVLIIAVLGNLKLYYLYARESGRSQAGKAGDCVVLRTSQLAQSSCYSVAS